MDLATDPKGYIRRRIELIKKERTARIAELLVQIDRLQARINAQKEELKEELMAEFLHLEAQIEKLPEPQRSEALATLQECKLKSLELLGILEETAEAAMIAALERGENIEETIAEIAKDLAYEAIGYEVSPQRIEHIATAILDVAASLATATPNYAEAILEGAIFGTRLAIQKAMERLKELLEFTPPEARAYLIQEQRIADLGTVDEAFRRAIEEVIRRSEPGIGDTIAAIAAKEPIFEQLRKEAQKAMEILKKGVSSLPQIKARAQEAKELGLRAFAIAKEKIDQAIKEAKDAIQK